MATREKNTELQELFDKGIPVYSFSKLECMHGCLYEAYRTYILHDKANQLQNVYSILGGSTHDVLEAITNGEATEADLLPTIEKDLTELDMLDITFPSDSIRDSWVTDMTHFCKTYKAPKGKFTTEEFFLYKSPNGNYLQGYIDLIKHNADGTVSIYDYKTSSMYKGEDIKKHGRQLIVYALGLEQKGFKVKNVAWIMLKYCEVKYVGKKTSRSKEETELSKVIERKNIVKELNDVIISKLEKKGYDEVDIECMMMNARETNEIPNEVADEFRMIPYVMSYELSDETRQDTIDYIDSTVEMWENLGELEINYPSREFTKTQKNGKVVDDTFYCNMLCGYRKVCPYLRKYLDTKGNNTEDEDLF